MTHVNLRSLHRKAKELADSIEIFIYAESTHNNDNDSMPAHVLSRALEKLPFRIADMDMPEGLKYWLAGIHITHKWALPGLNVDFLMREEHWPPEKIHELNEWMKANGLKLKERSND
jgi:hypothetical protein